MLWSELNHYLLLATVDIGDPGIEQELSALLPHGTQISGLGDFNSPAGVAGASRNGRRPRTEGGWSDGEG